MRRRIWAGIAVALALAFVISAAVVPLPYYLYKPGAVTEMQPLISVEGAPTYPADGSINYTTVLSRRATLFGLVSGWLDDDIEVLPERDVLGNRDVDENRRLNLLLMQDSKQLAKRVALERLGYDVEVSINGQVVVQVMPDMPASGVLTEGDTIVAVGDEPIDDPEDLQRLLGDREPGDTVTITVQAMPGSDHPGEAPGLGVPSDGGAAPQGEVAEREVELTLAASADDPERGIMGVQVMPRNPTYDFPIDVDIDTGKVGGPSAGLAFTLAILDGLTPGELTGGVPVAVTGEIRPDGSVGPVGGTGQKAAAVRSEGIEVFLVPSADYEAAVEHAGDVEVIRVDTLDDALAALAELGGNALDLPEVGAEEQRPAA